MPRRTLTAAAIDRLPPPKAGQADHFDQGFPGLALRISYGGAKTFVYFYRLNGKQRRLTLGRHPVLSLAEAREAWREARKAVDRGEDPAPDKPADADRFETVLAEWLNRDQGKNRSRAEVARLIEKDVKPAWKGRLIGEIGRRDVIELIDKIADRGAVTVARRVYAHLHRLFRWCVSRGIIAVNPVHDLPKPGEEVRRDRVLNDAELRLVLAATEKLGRLFGPAIKLLILTGARRDEIGGLTWSEVALPPRAGGEIALAGERSKNGEPHLIPLTAPARQILEGIGWPLPNSETVPRIVGSRFVFTTTGKTPVSGWSRAKQLLDREVAQLNDGVALPDWRLHDLRRSVATGLQRLGFALEVIEAVLGHISGSRAGIVGVYQRHAFDQEKRAALDAWARHLAAVVDGNAAGNVVPLTGMRQHRAGAAT